MDPHEAIKEFGDNTDLEEFVGTEMPDIPSGHLELVGGIELAEQDADSTDREVFLHLVGVDAKFDDPEQLSDIADGEELDLSYEGHAVTADIVRDFANANANHKVLTREEEIEYFRKINKGDEQAKEEFILLNQKLVMKIAFRNRFRTNASISLEDLISVGNEGMRTAVDKFDIKRGTKFSTYATWWIKQKIQRTFHNESSTIRLPVHVGQGVSKIARAQETLQKLGVPNPTPEQIAKKTGLTEDKVKELLHAGETAKVLSLDKRVGDEEDAEFRDFIPNDDDSVEDQVMDEMYSAKLWESIDKLKGAKKKILVLSYGLDGNGEKSKRKIMKIMKISSNTYENLIEEAHNDLKDIIIEEDNLYNAPESTSPEIQGPTAVRKERKKKPIVLTNRDMEVLSSLAYDKEELANSSGKTKEQVTSSRNALSLKINLKGTPMILLAYQIGNLELPDELDRLIVKLDRLYITPKEKICLAMSAEGMTPNKIADSSGMNHEEVKEKLQRVKSKIGKNNLPTKFAVLIAYIQKEIDLPSEVTKVMEKFNLKSADSE